MQRYASICYIILGRCLCQMHAWAIALAAHMAADKRIVVIICIGEHLIGHHLVALSMIIIAHNIVS